MIYTVECNYADPESEAEWNDFYSFNKLPALISVAGFQTSQRFKAAGCERLVYLAVHTIQGLEVLTGDEYRRKGGGNFARWQQHIIDWRRNIYSFRDGAPAVAKNELLAICSRSPEPLIRRGLAPCSMHVVALEMAPKHRWFATLDRKSAAFSGHLSDDIQFYAPMTERLTSARIIATKQ